jgi:hypothetical protein
VVTGASSVQPESTTQQLNLMLNLGEYGEVVRAEEYVSGILRGGE